MGKRTPSPPPPPNPTEVAAAQAQANTETAREQARLNRLNEFTPFGTATFAQTGDPNVPFSRTITLDPAEQSLLNAQRGTELNLARLGDTILNRVGPDLATPFSIPGDPVQVRDSARVEQALIDRLQPTLDQDRQRLETRLLTSGFDRNSEAFRRAMDEQNRRENDLRLAAIARGGAEQSRLFGLDQAARQQLINEAALGRSQPLNEIAAILGTGQVTAPNFGGVPQVGVAGTDIIGPTFAAHQADLNAFNQRERGRRRALGGLFGLGGSVLSAGLAPGGFLLS